MPLFEFQIKTEEGKAYASKVTAKSEPAAREQIAKKFNIIGEIGLKEVTPPKPKPAKQPASQVAKPPTPQPPKQAALPAKPAPAVKKQTKLEKLLFRQNGKCFFCNRALAKEQASIEHLLPKSGGGTNADGNVVACCVKLNLTLADMSLKEKVGFILGKPHPFQCPT